MVSLALFDIAGTTVYDPDGVGRCLKFALTEAGIPWTHEQVNAIMGIPKPVAIKSILDDAGMEASIDEIHENFRTKMLHYYETDPEVREIEGAKAMFDTLRAAGIKVGLDTGFDRPIIEKILDRLNWREAVDLTVASDEVSAGRPQPDLVYKAMEIAGVTEVENVAKIGDTPSDLWEGTNAKCRLVIGVTYGTHTREQLEPNPHTHLVDSVDELTKRILAREE